MRKKKILTENKVVFKNVKKQNVVCALYFLYLKTGHWVRERKTLTILTRSHFRGEVVYFSLSSTTQ